MLKSDKLLISFLVILAVFAILGFVFGLLYLDHYFFEVDDHIPFLKGQFVDFDGLAFESVKLTTSTGSSNTFPDTAQANVVFEAPAGKRCVIGNYFLEHASTAQTIVLAVADPSGTVIPVGVQTISGPSFDPVTFWMNYVLEPGQRLLVWCDVGTNVHLTVYTFDMEESAPQMAVVKLADSSVFTVPAGKLLVYDNYTFPVSFSWRLTHMYTGGPLTATVYLNDLFVLTQNVLAAPSATVPTLVPISAPMILNGGDQLRVDITPAGVVENDHAFMYLPYLLKTK